MKIYSSNYMIVFLLVNSTVNLWTIYITVASVKFLPVFKQVWMNPINYERLFNKISLAINTPTIIIPIASNCMGKINSPSMVPRRIATIGIK